MAANPFAKKPPKGAKPAKPAPAKPGDKKLPPWLMKGKK